MKIKIERPNEIAAAQIFGRYLTSDLPLDADEIRTSVAVTAEKCVRVDDRAHRLRDVPRRRGEPVPRGHLPER